MYYGGGVHQTADQGCSVAGQSPVARAWTARPIGCMCALSVTQKRHSSYNIAVTIEALHAFALIGSCRYSQLGTTKNPHERRYAATNRKQFWPLFHDTIFPPTFPGFPAFPDKRSPWYTPPGADVSEGGGGREIDGKFPAVESVQ